MGDDNTIGIGDWQVHRLDGVIRGPDGERRLRPKTMDVLLCLAASPGDVVTRDRLISEVWGRELISDEPLTTCIAELRRSLNDQRGSPRYIQTVPKRGYRLVAAVSSSSSQAGATAKAARPVEAEMAAAAQVEKLNARSAGTRLTKAGSIIGLIGLTAWLIIEALRMDAPPDTLSVDELGNEPSIAVLPFVSLSAEPDAIFFGAGIAEEILNGLTQIDGLRVTSRTSSFALKDRQLDVATIAERLGVSYILEGSVRRSGNTLRITAQLIDVASDSHVWSEVYEQESQEIFQIQRDISTRVTEALKLALNLSEKERLGIIGTTSASAYDYYLRGRQLIPRRTTVSLEKAAENFEAAIAIDAEFAQAHLGLADTYLLLTDYNDSPDTQWMERSLVAVHEALRLDPELGEAYATLGAVRHEQRDYDGAEAAFLEAVARAPNYPTTYHWYGFFLYDTAQQVKADKYLRMALRQDPLSSALQYGLGANLVAMGQFEEAEQGYQALLGVDPEFAWAYEGMAELNWHGRGRLDLAVDWYQRAVRYDRILPIDLPWSHRCFWIWATNPRLCAGSTMPSTWRRSLRWSGCIRRWLMLIRTKARQRSKPRRRYSRCSPPTWSR